MSPAPIEVHTLCREVAHQLASQWGENRQVVVPDNELNVLTDATPRDGTPIGHRQRPKVLPTRHLRRHHHHRHGSLVELAVRDDGSGIDPKIARQCLEQPFHPARDTATVGGGVGLGLFAANQAMKRIGASIHFHTPPDGGTITTIELQNPTPSADTQPTPDQSN